MTPRRHWLQVSSALALALTSGLLKPEDVFGQSNTPTPSAKDPKKPGILTPLGMGPYEAEWNGKIYTARRVEFMIRAFGDPEVWQETDLITVKAPELVENGAVVPVSVNSAVEGTDFLALIATLNPYPVCLGFYVLPGTLPEYATRIKVSESSTLVALARAKGKWYTASTEVAVIVGGCLR